MFYNNDSGWVPLSNKLVLLTVPKVDAFWFTPADAMGGILDGYGVYKLGKVIYYGKLAE